METVVKEIKSRFYHSGLRDACLGAYKTKLNLLSKLGFSFEEDNPRLIIEVGTKEDQLMARLREYPSRSIYHLHSMFQELMEANSIKSLVLDDNNNIVMPSGLSIRLSVFTKYCKDTDGTSFFDWQAINSFNMGSGLNLTIHPVDFANCSNQADGNTSWHSCFAPDGEYAGAPYAYINTPGTIMVMKGSPDNMVGRMWLHILYNDSGMAAGYCIMKTYGADFSHSELWSIKDTLSTALQLDLRCVDTCDIVTNNEVNASQCYNVSSSDNDYYVYLDPIRKVYLGRNFEDELYLTIECPFDIYGDEINSCDGNEFRGSDDCNDNNTACDHCEEGYNTDNEGTYLEDYERDVCDYCLNQHYSYINDTYVHEDDVEDAYTINLSGNVTTMRVDGRDDRGETYVHDDDLDENVDVECMHYCAECDCDHADIRIYEYLEVDYPDCGEVEAVDNREQETVEAKQLETTPALTTEDAIQAQVTELAKEFMQTAEYLNIEDSTERINLLMERMSAIQQQLLNNLQRNNNVESQQTTPIHSGSDYEVAYAHPHAA